MIDVEKMVCHNEDTSILYHHGASRISKKAFQQAKTIITDNHESNDSYLLLSGGYCGEDDFLPEEAVNVIA